MLSRTAHRVCDRADVQAIPVGHAVARTCRSGPVCSSLPLSKWRARRAAIMASAARLAPSSHLTAKTGLFRKRGAEDAFGTGLGEDLSRRHLHQPGAEAFWCQRHRRVRPCRHRSACGRRRRGWVQGPARGELAETAGETGERHGIGRDRAAVGAAFVAREDCPRQGRHDGADRLLQGMVEAGIAARVFAGMHAGAVEAGMFAGAVVVEGGGFVERRAWSISTGCCDDQCAPHSSTRSSGRQPSAWLRPVATCSGSPEWRSRRAPVSRLPNHRRQRPRFRPAQGLHALQAERGKTPASTSRRRRLSYPRHRPRRRARDGGSRRVDRA